MSERDSELTHREKLALQRIATLQRMREDALKGNRAAMLASIDKLLALETHVLREAKDTDAEPA